MKVTIIGSGAYGLALALMVNKNTKEIEMWTKFEEEKNMLLEKRENEKVLKGVKIPENINFTTDLNEVVTDASLIIIAVPTAFIDSISKELKGILKHNQHVCIASKGIEQETCLFVQDIFYKYNDNKNFAVISGPSFAVDIANMCPVGLSLATLNDDTEKIVKDALESDLLKLRRTNDIIGVEICGAIKNVIAIASGMLDGMGHPASTQAMFITESLHDIKHLINDLGGSKKTILSFAGFGDLLLTATSIKSRNYRLGKLIGEKKSKEEIDDYINNTTIEGLYTLKSIKKLLDDKNLELPIIDLIYNIIYGNSTPETLVKFLIEK